MKNIFSKNTLLTMLLVLIWGATWPINKLAVAYTPPFFYAGIRTFIGGLILAVVIHKTFHKLKFKENWLAYTIAGFFNTFLFFGLHTVGLLYLPGGLFSVLVYIQPILLGVFAWLVFGENFTGIKLFGLLLGFAGIFMASLDGITTHISIIGVSLALLTGISWTFGVIYVKKVSEKVDPFWIVVMQNIIGGFALLVLALIFESWNDIVWNIPLSVGMMYGIIFGVSIAYLIYYSLINAGEASKVGVATFLVPIISVLLSVVFLNEPFTLELFIGMVLVGLSILLVNLDPKNYPIKRRGLSRK